MVERIVRGEKYIKVEPKYVGGRIKSRRACSRWGTSQPTREGVA